MTVFHRASIQKASTLSEDYYTAPEIFAQERQHIFYNHWLCVGRSQQIPEAGDYFLTQIGEENLIILRDAQGSARAFFNVCRHRGTHLCRQAQGHLGDTIRCSAHGWRYSLEGQLRSARCETVPPEENALFACALYEWEGFLWTNLAPNPAPFTQTFSLLLGQFAPWRLASLRVGQQVIYDLQANWKLIFQTYCDRHHHTGMARRSLTLNQGTFLGASQPLDRDLTLPLPSLCSEQGDRAYYYSLFPTMLLSLHPGYAIAYRLSPQSASRTRIICEWLFDRHTIDRPTACAEVVEAGDLKNRQAWFNCEQMQRVMRSPIHPSAQTAFDREYLRVLGKLSAVR